MAINHFWNSQRCQTNAAWSCIFQFVTDKSAHIPVSIAGWTLIGTAQRTNLPDIKTLDLVPRMNLMDDTSKLLISLSEDDTAMLGVGRIAFEVLRIDPEPQRPILKFFVENHLGVAQLNQVMPV